MPRRPPRSSPRSPALPPANATEGAAAVLQSTVKLFDRHDGEGADWRMIAETLFKAAFDVLDRLPDNQKKPLARRVHAGAYDRLSGNSESDFAPSKTASPEGGLSPSNTFDLKSSPDGPGK
jgi:hypothetical protein